MSEGAIRPTSDEHEDDRAQATRRPVLTLEGAVYSALGVLALVVRLAALGVAPLLVEEVPTALAASQVLAGRPLEAAGYLPLLFDAQVVLISPGTNLLSVRLFTALAGSLFLLLPYSLRHVLGRYGALATAVLIAFSPTFVYAGRTADGAVVSMALGACGVSLLVGSWSTGWRWCRRLAAASLGLALAAGPQVITMLAALAIVATAYWSQAAEHGREQWRERLATPGRLVLILVAAWILGATAGLLNPGGLGAAVDTAGDWFGTLLPSVQVPWYQSLRALVVYEPLALLLGLYGLYRGWRRRSMLDVGLGVWLLIALLLATLAGHREALWMLCVTLPLALLAGRGVQHIVDGGRLALSRRDALAFAAGLCLVGFALMELGGYLQTLDNTYLGLAALGAGLLIVALVGYGVWTVMADSVRVGASLVLSLALVLSVRGTVALAYDRARDPWEPMLTGPTAGTLSTLGPLLEHLSLTSAGDPRAVDILYEQSLDPMMAWLVREYPNAKATVRVGAQSGATLLISGPRAPGTEPEGYVGHSMALRERPGTDGRSVVQVIQWLLYRQAGPGVQRDEFWVWVKIEPGGGNGE
jgi:hypothetical protein